MPLNLSFIQSGDYTITLAVGDIANRWI